LKAVLRTIVIRKVQISGAWLMHDCANHESLMLQTKRAINAEEEKGENADNVASALHMSVWYRLPHAINRMAGGVVTDFVHPI
jgi:hypothetical protein